MSVLYMDDLRNEIVGVYIYKYYNYYKYFLNLLNFFLTPLDMELGILMHMELTVFNT